MNEFERFTLFAVFGGVLVTLWHVVKTREQLLTLARASQTKMEELMAIQAELEAAVAELTASVQAEVETLLVNFTAKVQELINASPGDPAKAIADIQALNAQVQANTATLAAAAAANPVPA